MVPLPLTGLNEPIPTTPPRAPGSVRRTSTIDMRSIAGGGLALDGAARDIRTAADGHAVEVLDQARVRARLDEAHVLVSIATSAPDALTEPLVGLTVRRGFRDAVHQHLPAKAIDSTALGLLLDELPVAALISGYALLYSGELGATTPSAGSLQADICAGWRSDGTMIVSLVTTGTLPVPMGPEVNSLTDDDPDGWHEMAPLPPATMRRQRLIDVDPGAPHAVRAMFRDTHADKAGRTTILHEYSLATTYDPEHDALGTVLATPHVLPWDECPAAADSAARLDGRAPGELRELVRDELRGTSTCTHLNDLLRSLANISALASSTG